MRAATTPTSPSRRAHDEFLRLLPGIEAHARSVFNTLRCPHDREDAVAEVVARAWEQFLGEAARFATEGLTALTSGVRDEPTPRPLVSAIMIALTIPFPTTRHEGNMKLARHDTDPVQDKFAQTRTELAATLIERDEEIDLALTALVANEHVLLVGQPGCGKSLLLDSVLAWTGGQKFSILLNKFSVPEELVGPVSLTGLKEDRYVRVTTGKLPEADYAFLDEVFKASSAILNVMLKILNERTYDAGDGVVRAVPLKLCVAASNEWPSPETGKELAALFDRFLLRRAVSPIRSLPGRQRLLWTADHTPTLSTTVSPTEVVQVRRTARALPWSNEAKEAFEVILRELAREGIQPGDRRQFKTVGVIRAFAYLAGASEVEPEHIEVAAHTLWDDPHEQPQKVAQVIARIANPTGMRVTQLLLETELVIADCDVRNLADAAKAAAKLSEIDRQLAGLRGNGRLDSARTYLREQLKKLKLASIEAI